MCEHQGTRGKSDLVSEKKFVKKGKKFVKHFVYCDRHQRSPVIYLITFLIRKLQNPTIKKKNSLLKKFCGLLPRFHIFTKLETCTHVNVSVCMCVYIYTMVTLALYTMGVSEGVAIRL